MTACRHHQPSPASALGPRPMPQAPVAREGAKKSGLSQARANPLLIRGDSPQARLTVPAFFHTFRTPVLGSAAFPSTMRQIPKPTHRAPTAREWVGPHRPQSAHAASHTENPSRPAPPKQQNLPACQNAPNSAKHHPKPANRPIRAQSALQIVSSVPKNDANRPMQAESMLQNDAGWCTPHKNRQTNPIRYGLIPPATPCENTERTQPFP